MPRGRDIIATINSLLDLPFALKCATQDWHPPDHVSFHSSHPGREPFSQLITHNPANQNESDQITLWPMHCVQGTPGANLVPDLHLAKIHHLVKKGQDRRVEMFSAFQDNFNFPCLIKTELESILKRASITTVYVVGLAANHCVKHTSFHAADAGFNTVVLKDATKGIDDSDSAMVSLRTELAARGVRFQSLAESKFSSEP